jgi:excisionase family DNA binding protein
MIIIMEKQVYTIAEASKYLGVSEAKIKRLIVGGKLKAFNISLGNERKHFRISKESLLALINEPTA